MQIKVRSGHRKTTAVGWRRGRAAEAPAETAAVAVMAAAVAAGGAG